MFGSSPSAKQNDVRGVIGVADVETGSMIGIWKEHRGAIWSLAVSPDGKVVASGGAARVSGWTGGDDLTIHLWEVPTGRELARWHAHDGGVTALVFSRDGQTLFSGGGDGSLKVWDLSGLRKELTRLGFE
jgi:WD40 repeat protein